MFDGSGGPRCVLSAHQDCLKPDGLQIVAPFVHEIQGTPPLHHGRCVDRRDCWRFRAVLGFFVYNVSQVGVEGSHATRRLTQAARAGKHANTRPAKLRPQSPLSSSDASGSLLLGSSPAAVKGARPSTTGPLAVAVPSRDHWPMTEAHQHYTAFPRGPCLAMSLASSGPSVITFDVRKRQ